MADSEFSRIKERLIRNKQLYEDPEFPASRYSIQKDGNVSSLIVWKRPTEIFQKRPKFVIRGATRFDLFQGSLGDCWFIAAVGCLAVTSQKLFERVVPPDQSFDEGEYAGIFRFNFWQFDHWTEVVIDDRIPTKYGEPVYAHNRTSGEYNEFWVALVEKAYAKLYGGYANINGGHINDALVDFTGGISEKFDLKDDRQTLEPTLYELMRRTALMNTMMGCSIDTDKIGEEDLGNGLYAGHAYSITKISTVKLFGNTVRLLRLRNPWGRGEWTGAWGDKSREWMHVSDEDKKKLGLIPKTDGEFWMEYSEWLRTFEDLNMCHLYPDSLTAEVAVDMKRQPWDVTKHHGEWVRGFSAGGCGNSPYESLFWTNPQFGVTLNKTDDIDADGKCTLVVSLMQKTEALADELFVAFQIYKLRSGRPILLDGQNYEKNALHFHASPQKFTNIRESTAHLRVNPGTYVVIPSTFQPNKEGSFYMRIFTETNAEANILDNPTVIDRPTDSSESMLELFMKYSGGERRVDAIELQKLLNDIYKRDLDRGFGTEVCRGLIAMMDRDQSGLLDFDEFRKMLKEINVWKSCYSQFDTNRSGDIDTYELGKVFEAIGFHLSRSVTSSIVRRYGGKKRRLGFEDFIQCCTKIVVMYGEFSKKKKAGEDHVELTLEEWLSTTMLH